MARPIDPVEQAARWVARDNLVRIDPREAAEVHDWLTAAPGHPAAARRALDVWDDLQMLRDDPDLRAMIPVPAAANDDSGGQRRTIARGSVAVGLTLAVALAGIVLAPPPAVAFVTGIGEQRRVEAARGMAIFLNTNSRVRIDYGWLRDRVIVERGEADVSVAPRSLTDVSIETTQLGVTTDGGRVLMRGGNALALDGEVIRADTGTALVSTAADRDAATAWQRGQIVLDDVTLAGAIAEFARYQALGVSLAPESARLRISGTYRIGSADGFVRTLPRVLPVKVQPLSGDQLRVEPAPR